MLHVARRLMTHTPAVVITPSGGAADTTRWAAVLNLLAGSLRPPGTVRERRMIPFPGELVLHRNKRATRLEELPDHSMRVMVIDESLSGLHRGEEWIRRKLVEEDGVILSLSPFVTPRPYATQYVLPSPVAGETTTDLAGVDEGGRSVYAVVRPLVEAPEKTVDSFSLCRMLGRALGCGLPAGEKEPEDLLKARVARLLASGRGSLFNGVTGETADLASVLSADDLWSVLAAGGCWTDGKSPDRPGRRVRAGRILEASADDSSAPSVLMSDSYPLLLVQAEDPSLRQSAAISPVISKLYQESGLRLCGDRALLHPATAAQYGLSDGQKAVLETPSGSSSVRVSVNAALQPGVVYGRVPPRPDVPQESGRLPLLAENGTCFPSTQPVRVLKA
jgi:hypothetical protein